MNSENRDAKTIFGEALKLTTPGERQAYLDQACAGNQELRQEVESLLGAYARAQEGDFLGQTRPLPASDFLIEPTGTMIGRYKLLQRIGEGGFGVVYMAEQEEPVRRRVALKIIKLGMDTKEVVARFDAERQALAMMDHPNIAHVFDGGATDTGRPYFVMELVKGVPITEYCDTKLLSTRERLELFMQVCHAVQHAHQKGVIHRDLKPSNVLVTEQDDRPVPKVIDFGVAKATQARLTEKTLFTRFNQWIGTPAYMSPEQAGLGSLDVDTRSDIYSLGVLLYELLTGRTPFDTQKLLAAGYDAVMRTIREEDPPKPSARLSTLAKEELSAVAAQRGAEPAKLGRLVRGDLDWIVMKALEKDRTRRYETANAFARDVAAYLEQEPVSAAAPSAAYRVRRFIGRNRLVVGFSTALALSLVLGTIISAWQAWLAKRFFREAVAQRATATNEAARALIAREQSEVSAYSSRILLAEKLWQSGDFEDAEKTLDECAAPLRGWEWSQLKRQFHSELLSIPPPQPAPTKEPEFGESHLAFIRKDTELWVSQRRHDGACYSVTNGVALGVNTNWLSGVPTPDGHRFVSQAKPGAPAAVNDIASGRVLTTFQAAPGTAVALSPDESLIASWGTENPWKLVLTNQCLLISSATNGQLLQKIFMSDGGGRLLWSPDSRWLAAGGRITNRLVEASSGRIVFALDVASALTLFQQGAFSSDSKRFAWAWGKGPNWGEERNKSDAECCTLSVLDLLTERRLFEQGLRSEPSVVSFADGDRTLVLASASSIRNVETAGEVIDDIAQDDLTFFDATSGKLKGSLRLELGFSPLLVSANGKRLAVGSYDGSVHLMELAHPQPHQILRGHRTSIAALAFDSQGSRLASLDQSGELKLWDVSQSATPSLKRADVDWEKLGPYLRIANGRCVIWTESHCTRIADLDRHQCLALLDEASRLSLSPDGRWLVAGDEIWDITRGELVRRIPHVDQRLKCRLSGNGQRAAILADPGSSLTIQVVELKTWTSLGAPLATTWETWQSEDSLASFALNHDGTLAAISSPNGLVRICRIATGTNGARSLCTFSGAPPYQFGPDGSWLLTGRTNGGFQQVEVCTGIARKTFPGPKQVRGFEVSRSGRHVRVWKNLDMMETWGEGWRGEVWCLETGEFLAAVPLTVGDESFVFNPSGTRMAIPGTDGFLRIWDLDQRRMLMPLPVQAFAWGWSPDGNKLTVVRKDLEIEEFDGSPWKVGEQKPSKVPFQLLTRPQQTSVPGVQLVARLDWTAGGANGASVAVRPPVVYQSFGGRMCRYQLPNDDGERAAFVEGSLCDDVHFQDDFVRRGEYLFATSRDRALEVYRLGGLSGIPQRVTVTGPVNGGFGSRLVVANDILCVLGEYVHIYDVAEPASPVQKGIFRATLPARTGCLMGPRLYLGLGVNYTNLVEAVDIRDPQRPVFLGQLSLPGLPYELLDAGPGRLVALLGGSAVLIDIRDPARLRMIGEPLRIPAFTGVVMPWGGRRLLITGEAAVSVAEHGLKLEGWLPGRGHWPSATSEDDLAVIPSVYGAYVFRVRPPP
jgi:serine/threonine protein kinase/WD40 repeat protein